MEIFILLGLILLNGLFAMSEIAIVTAKKSRLTNLANRGSRSAAIALKLAEDPTQFLSTVQIGITSIGIMNGIFGESILAEPFALWLQTFGVPVTISDNFATVLVVVVVTYLSIVVGELVPKRIGQVSAESIACTMARPMQLLAVITKPFVYLLSASTHALMRLTGFHLHQGQNVTEEDIHAILDEGSSSGIIEAHEHKLVKNVLRLEDRSIVSLMIPRADIVFLDVTLSAAENYQRVLASHHSRFPVCRKNNEDLLGVVSAKELLAVMVSGKELNLTELARPAHLVPETLTGMELLEFFRSSNTPMVFVVDEYGDVKGLVTMQDLLEALTGEFIVSSDEDTYIKKRDDGSLLLDGMLAVVDLKDCLQISYLPGEGQYQTLNGLIMFMMGKVPSTGDKVTIQNWELEIIDMDGRRIDKVLASQLPDPDEDG